MKIPDYLDGAIDLHVHSAPDIDDRRFNDLELAKEAAKAGLGAILLKSHQSSTVERAYLVSRVVKNIRVYGGIVLNCSVGGLNPNAVEVALQLGARQVWMPTRSARNHRRHLALPEGITVTNDIGELSPVAKQIVAMAAEAGCAVGTGHLSPEEVFPLAKYAAECGLPCLLVTHPEWSATHYTIEQQKRLAEYGNVFFERCFVSTTHRCGFIPWSVIENAISDVGVDTTVLSTDLGQPDTPPPVEGLLLYAERMRAAGFSPSDLHRMMRTNPEAILHSGQSAQATVARAAPE